MVSHSNGLRVAAHGCTGRAPSWNGNCFHTVSPSTCQQRTATTVAALSVPVHGRTNICHSVPSMEGWLSSLLCFYFFFGQLGQAGGR